MNSRGVCAVSESYLPLDARLSLFCHLFPESFSPALHFRNLPPPLSAALLSAPEASSRPKWQDRKCCELLLRGKGLVVQTQPKPRERDAMAEARQKQLRIKTGVVKRLVKEKASYQVLSYYYY